MADKIDDSRYFWKARSEDGHFKIGLNDDARVEFGEISSVTFFIKVGVCTRPIEYTLLTYKR